MTKEEVFNFIRQHLSFSKCPEMNQRQANARFSTQRFWTSLPILASMIILLTFFSTSTMALQPFISNISPKMKIWNIHLPDIPQRKSSLQFLNWLSSPESPKEIAAKKKNCTERQCEVKRLLWLSFISSFPSYSEKTYIFVTRFLPISVMKQAKAVFIP